MADQMNLQLGEYKTIGRRFFAGMVDFSIASAIALPIVLLVPEQTGLSNYLLNLLGSALLFELYIVVTTKTLGGTLGKIYFNLRILSNPDEVGVTWVQALVREVINLFLSMLPLIPLLIFLRSNSFQYSSYVTYLTESNFGNLSAIVSLTIFGTEIVTSLASQKRRAIHDMLAGTVVKKVGPYRKFSKLIAAATCLLSLVIFGIAVSQRS